jgi:predicted PurR-regulated permease PerM
MRLTAHQILRYVLFLLVAAATIYFLYIVREVVLSFAVGAFLAYLLFRPVQYFEKKGFSRVWSILILYLIFIGGLSLVVWLAIPRIVAELGDIAQAMPHYAAQAQDLAARLEQMDLPAQAREIIRENTARIEGFIYNSLKGFIAGIYKLLSKIFIIIFAPILAFYILKDWDKIKNAFLNLFTPAARADCIALAQAMDTVLIEFFKGHLLVATMVGTLTGLAAFIIGVKYAVLIGIISGITNLVPYFGPFLGGIPAVALALSESARMAIYMAVAIIAVQQIESNLVTPRIIGDRLGLHPLVIVFALLAGGELLGIWGMLFAVPITGILKVAATFAFSKLVE